MPNILRLSVVDHKADDFIDWFNMLEQGVYSTSSAGTEFGPSGTALMSSDDSTLELRVDYVTIGGVVHATGMSGYYDEVTIHFDATFQSPEPLGFGTWTTAGTTLFDALLGDARIIMTGRGGDDWAAGFDFNDRFTLRSGDDAAYGGDGNDVLMGGRGMDLLIGGAGNDVLVFEGGVNVARGGTGRDIFVFDSFQTSAGGSPNVLRTVVQDLEAGDLLVFGGHGVSPDTIDPSSETLGDLENGSIDDFRWRETANGVVIDSGDARVVLRGVTADQVNLDMILFSENSALETAELFDNTGTGGTLGSGVNGDAFITFGAEGSTFITFGAETTTFDTYGGDISGFYLGAFPMI